MRRGQRTRSRLARLLAATASLAVVVTGLAVVQVDGQSTQAVTAAAMLDSFDPADIISDGVMFNGDTMTPAAIQTFLEAQQPTCVAGSTCLKSLRADIPAMPANPMCAALKPADDQTVAEIVSAVGRACSVNPQVILVMLQKEQTLITGRRPYTGETVDVIYRKATGLGCPDTAPCDPAKYGLFNQLYGVAFWLVRYTMPPGTGPGTAYSSLYNWFPVGRPNGVLYNPNAGCGAGTITIQNKATASLYYYTPYQPNAAALAAGWGVGNSCSAYGNRNFFLYFTTWFGSTHYTVTGAIASYWKAHDAGKGVLGDPAGPPTEVAAAGGGTAQRFGGGVVYTSAAGTFAVRGSTAAKYTAAGGPAGALGWPVGGLSTRKSAGGGTAQGFQHGAVYASSTGTWTVGGALFARYTRAKSEAGELSWPIGDEVVSTVAGGGRSQAFRGGRIVVTPTASVLVTGAVAAKWLQRGAEASTLGWPVEDAAIVKAHDVSGTVQTFRTGSVYVLGTKVYTVTGDMMKDYRFHGGPTGSFGWPRAANARSEANGGGWAQRFVGATLYSSVAAGTHPLTGVELKRYNLRGGTKGTLGWPGARTHDSAGIGGAVTTFTDGRMYVSKAGTAAVLGDVLKKYLAKHGTGGVLGWPTGDATVSHGTTTQRFEHGSITWTLSGGATAHRS